MSNFIAVVAYGILFATQINIQLNEINFKEVWAAVCHYELSSFLSPLLNWAPNGSKPQLSFVFLHAM